MPYVSPYEWIPYYKFQDQIIQQQQPAARNSGTKGHDKVNNDDGNDNQALQQQPAARNSGTKGHDKVNNDDGNDNQALVT
ncbi:hypothetical protein Glove_543g27 [Diversispora epigaea]|uniref:Uncharacterized protein n=1 Tax=Diversispora epigaea TaxID=1348612 RepID=A0A397GH25_9GLOM|nr:hypothetical protein Glove_543g27 [Diversispora epigaea]